MTRRDISFQTGDGVTLRGWLFTPSRISTNSHHSSIPPSTPSPDTASKLPCLILTHGFSCTAEMGLSPVAESLVESLPITCLVYDHRGFGRSSTHPSQPRHEIVPSAQISDLQDAITHAQTLENVDPTRIALWGYSFSGGHALYLGAVDRRVKAVISLAPTTDGWNNFLRLARPDLIDSFNQGFEADRLGRAAGKPPLTIPVVAEGVFDPCALPSRESWEYFSQWTSQNKYTEEEGEGWKNEVTLRSAEYIRSYNLAQAHLKHITPTPVFMAVAKRDTNTPPDMSFATYNRLSEPKQLCILPGHHYDVLGKDRGIWMKEVVQFLKTQLCAPAEDLNSGEIGRVGTLDRQTG